MKVQNRIDRMNEIYKNAYMKSPYFLRGLLIPDHNVEEFQILMHRMMEDAKLSEEYWEQICQATRDGQEATHDYMISLIKGIKEGTIKFGSEAESKPLSMPEEFKDTWKEDMWKMMEANPSELNSGEKEVDSTSSIRTTSNEMTVQSTDSKPPPEIDYPKDIKTWKQRTEYLDLLEKNPSDQDICGECGCPMDNHIDCSKEKN